MKASGITLGAMSLHGGWAKVKVSLSYLCLAYSVSNPEGTALYPYFSIKERGTDYFHMILWPSGCHTLPISLALR